MSRLGAVDLQFGDGEYSFRLRMAQLIELDEKFEVGPQRMLIDFANDGARVTHVREIIRLGLIGGGMKPPEAYTLVKNYVDQRPLMESVMHAQVILAAAVVGLPEDEPPGKPEAPEGANELTPADE
jgi:hypothetical protein